MSSEPKRRARCQFLQSITFGLRQPKCQRRDLAWTPRFSGIFLLATHRVGPERFGPRVGTGLSTCTFCSGSSAELDELSSLNLRINSGKCLSSWSHSSSFSRTDGSMMGSIMLPSGAPLNQRLRASGVACIMC